MGRKPAEIWLVLPRNWMVELKVIGYLFPANFMMKLLLSKRNSVRGLFPLPRDRRLLIGRKLERKEGKKVDNINTEYMDSLAQNIES